MESIDPLSAGVELHRRGDIDGAKKIYSAILAADADNPNALHLMGIVARQRRDISSAIVFLKRACDLRPLNDVFLIDYADALHTGNRFEEAVAVYEQALKMRPDAAVIWYALACAHRGAGNLETALSNLQRALDRQPDFFEALCNCADILIKKNNYAGAIPYLQRALSLRPDYFEACYNLGNCFREINDLDRALLCFAKACDLQPSSAPAVSNYAEALQIVGRVDEALQRMETLGAIAGEKSPAIASNVLLWMNYAPAAAPQALYERHVKFGTTFGCLGKHPRCFKNIDPLKPLRVGYVSPDFCDHPVSRFIEPVLTYHDRKAFEVYCYCEGARIDEVTRRLRSLPVIWRRIHGVSDEDALRMVSGDGIDILVDLAGHTAQNRLPLFARKAAPVQLSYCGYPNTTGLAEIDYYVTDANLDSEDDASLYTERLLRIPGCFCCYMPSDNTPQVNDLPALRAGHITFGSLHPLMRLSGAVLDLFSAVLKAAPSARLRIVRDTLQGEAKRRLEGEFLKRGIDPLRIDLVHELPRQGHLALYHGIDIALDTFPWSGHTAACESLWMGVPTVTLFGNRHAGRMAATILRNVGLPQWVAASEEDYCAVACRAAADFDKLKTMRRNLRQQMVASIVCDAQEFTRKLEAAYTTAWRNWRSTQL